MVNHFENYATAAAHLAEKGFKPCGSGRFVTVDVVASIHPVTGSDRVAIFFQALVNA